MHGLIWRIGDGSKVNAYHDNWIPRSGSLVPLGAEYVPHVTKVADLMNQQGSAWDETKLQQAFSDDEVKEIKQIIVGGPGTEDYRAWNHTKSGVFSVRSAYHLGMSIKGACMALATSSSSAADHKSFLELWAADVPNKMKIHTWRIISNGLAVGIKLHKRRIKPGVFCIACGREESRT